MNKLSEDEISKVIKKYKKGKSGTKIAEEFNVSAPAIYGLLNRRNIKIRSQKEDIKDRYCIRCGDKIPYKKHDYPKKYHQKKFCSITCSAKYNNNQRKGQNTTIIDCSQCGKEIEIANSKLKEDNFCSKKCWYGFKKTAEYIECDNCGKEFKEYQSKIKNHDYHFCSEQCRKEGYSGNRVYTWKGGIRSKWRGENWEQVRKERLNKDNFTCQDCGLTNKESLNKFNTPLQVHHIIPYSETQDNSLDNLISLCPSCHMSTERGRQSEENRS